MHSVYYQRIQFLPYQVTPLRKLSATSTPEFVLTETETVLPIPTTSLPASDKTRLDRIEEKIDRMSEAVIALARAEEKIISLDETTRMILRKMVSQDERLRKVENTQHDNETTIKTIKSVVWTTISALITTAVATLAWLFTGSK